jgi:hypothetical protein
MLLFKKQHHLFDVKTRYTKYFMAMGVPSVERNSIARNSKHCSCQNSAVLLKFYENSLYIHIYIQEVQYKKNIHFYYI